MPSCMVYGVLCYVVSHTVFTTLEMNILFVCMGNICRSPTAEQIEGNIVYLWDGQAMSRPENYDEIGYRNYLTGECFTVDMGEHYHLKRFKANLYWAYTNVCPKKYELWGYKGEGVPPVDGNWSNWTKLGSLNNSVSTLADFAAGDELDFTKEESPLVRYIRVRCLENYRTPPSTAISLCEITFWAWNNM